MPTLEQINAALKGQLETVVIPSTGVTMTGRVHDFLTGTQEPPSITIVPGGQPGKSTIEYDSTFARGSDDHLFTLALTVSRVAEKDSFTQLNAFLAGDGPSSIKAAVEADETLGGLVSFAHVPRVLAYGPLRWNEVSFFGAQLICQVTT